MRQIPIRNSGKVALVDNEDYHRVIKYEWRLKPKKDGILRCSEPYTSLHGLVMQDYDNEYDHKDRDVLNNQKDNLRLATRSQNCANRAKADGFHSSEYKGVDWFKPRSCWRVRVNKKHVGLFSDELEAARAYNKKALELFGEFACLNKVD